MNLDGLPGRITALRLARGYGKSELARRAHRDRSFLHELERGGKGRVYLADIAAIATALQVRPSTLLRGWAGQVPAASPCDLPLEVFDHEVRSNLSSSRRARGVGLKLGSKLAGINQAWLSRVESGQLERINLATLRKFCEALDIDILDQVVVPAEVHAIDTFTSQEDQHHERTEDGGTAAHPPDPAEPAG